MGFLIILVVGVALVFWYAARRPAHVAAAATDGQQSLQALDLSDPSGECDFHIVGESNYQPEPRRVARSGRTFRAVVLPEPSNPRDPNAIRVCAEGGRTVGYFDRDYARQYREVFVLLASHNHVGACKAKLIGGVPGKKSFGVMLNIKDPETILVDVRDTLAPGSEVSSSVQPF